MKQSTKLILTLIICSVIVSIASYIISGNKNSIEILNERKMNKIYANKKALSSNGKFRIESTPIGEFTIGTDFKVHPSINNQKESYLVNSGINSDTLFGLTNITIGPNGNSYTLGGYFSTNGGDSWFGNDTTYYVETQFNVDPAPVMSVTGRAVATFINSTSHTEQVYSIYSTNFGANWSAPIAIPDSYGADKCWAGVDNNTSSSYYGRLYSVFSNGRPYRIFFSSSNDEGESWSGPIPVSPQPTNFFDSLNLQFLEYGNLGAEIKTLNNGHVIVTWINYLVLSDKFGSQISENEDSIGFAKSTDGGESWITTSNHADDMNGLRILFGSALSGFNAYSMPRLEIDKNNNWIYVACAEKNYPDNPNYPALDKADIILHRSTDEGATWEKFRVNQDIASNLHYQFLPAICVDKFGGVNIIYYDTRNTPALDSCEIYLSRSTDGGQSFTDIKISGQKFGIPNSRRGDYVGLSNSKNKIIPFWFGFDRVTEKYQVYSAEIDILPTILNVSVNTEGLYNYLNHIDTFTVYLRSGNFPFAIIDSSKIFNDNDNSGKAKFNNTESGTYFLSIKHRNSIEVWSHNPVFIRRGSVENFYSFIDSVSSAYGNNLKNVLNMWTMFSGDVNQDGIVDISDLGLIQNDAYYFTNGYVNTDLNGDFFVDVSDIAISENNASFFVTKITPLDP